MTERDEQLALKRLWESQEGKEIQPLDEKGQKAGLSMKLIGNQPILRLPTHAVYPALSKTTNNTQSTYKKVAVKKYLSQGDIHEYRLLSDRKELQDIFGVRPLQSERQFFLMLPEVQCTLEDKLRHGVREFRDPKDKVNLRKELYSDFKRQMLELLDKCHQLSPSFFLAGLRPTSIGVTEHEESETKRTYTYQLIDFGQAGVSDASKCLHLYDLRYLAPEFSTLSQYSDLWSFGCLLYELLSNGDRLINDVRFHSWDNDAKKRFIEERLKEVSCKMQLLSIQKIKAPQEAVALLRACLMILPKSRKLLEREQEGMGSEQLQFWKNKLVYDLSLEIFRLSQLQDSMMSVFEQLYFNSGSISKRHLYPLLKFASCAYLQDYARLKDKAKNYAKNEKWDKYSQAKHIQEEKKITDIRDKAASKLIKELDHLKDTQHKNKLLTQFPEIFEEKVVHPRKAFQDYWQFISKDICRGDCCVFYKHLYNMHFYMQEAADMERMLERVGKPVLLRVERKELEEKKDPQLVYFLRASAVSEAMEQQVEAVVREGEGLEERMGRALAQAIDAVQ